MKLIVLILLLFIFLVGKSQPKNLMCVNKDEVYKIAFNKVETQAFYNVDGLFDELVDNDAPDLDIILTKIKEANHQLANFALKLSADLRCASLDLVNSFFIDLPPPTTVI